jgi:hypothetical protein
VVDERSFIIINGIYSGWIDGEYINSAKQGCLGQVDEEGNVLSVKSGYLGKVEPNGDVLTAKSGYVGKIMENGNIFNAKKGMTGIWKGANPQIIGAIKLLFYGEL